MKQLNCSKPEFYDNTEKKVIIISPAQLNSTLDKVSQRGSNEKYFSLCLGIFFTVLPVLITADFHDVLGLEGSIWKGIFLSSLPFSFVGIIFFLWRKLQFGEYNKASLVKNLLSSTKKNNKMK